MITYEEALKIAKEQKEHIDHFYECEKAYVFSYSGDANYIGGLGHTPVVILKEDGRQVTMPELVYMGTGKTIKECDL